MCGSGGCTCAMLPRVKQCVMLVVVVVVVVAVVEGV